MKAFFTLAVVCLIASALANPLELNEEQKAKAKVHFQECVKQENVSEEDATKLRNREFANASPSMKCFGTCFFEKVGTLKDSQVQEEVVLQKLGALIGEEKTKEVLHKCKDIKGEDRCDTGFKIYECFESYKAQLTA
ncbi:general odorant-binding protein 56a-like [Calliphora vicina]|uniref:general odorant-binding protein 56a-like n=1 Tax=Calliphora vicina TaxID=7373 RepID=UPI00325BEF07